MWLPIAVLFAVVFAVIGRLVAGRKNRRVFEWGVDYFCSAGENRAGFVCVAAHCYYIIEFHVGQIVDQL